MKSNRRLAPQIRTLWVVVVICLVSAPSMRPQVEKEITTNNGQATKDVTVERGEVVMVDGNDLIIKREDGQIVHFPNVPESTKITVAGKQLSIHDLQPGMKLERTIRSRMNPKTVATVQLVTGTVWHVTPPISVMLRLKDGTYQQFTFPKGQKFMVNGREIDARELRRGMTISATRIVEEPAPAVTQTGIVFALPSANVPILFAIAPFQPRPAPVEVASIEPTQLPIITQLPSIEAMQLDIIKPAQLDIISYQVVQVFFATDRALGEHSPELQTFTGERSKTENLTLGVAEISIPRDHRMGELEAPSLLRLEFRQDPNKHVVLLKAKPLNSEEFHLALRNKLKGDKKKQILVFVHGYNTTFEDGARNLGQIVYDLAFAGAPILYSWPSQGNFWGYMADEDSNKWSATHFIEFLEDLHRDPDVGTIYLVGHSMGNRLVAEALKSLAPNTSTSPPMFSEVVMAAPDIDEGVFRQGAVSSRKAASRITIYESSADQALRWSHRIHDFARLGDTDPTPHVFRDYECVVASAIDTSLSGHSYIRDNDSILGDIYDLLTKDMPAGERFRLEEVHDGNGLPYWAFKR